MNSHKYKRRVNRRNEATKEIFFAAARAINKNHTISLANMAEELGGTRGTIYYYFKTKGDLLYQMQNYVHTQIAKAIEPILQNKNMTALQKLKKVLYTYTLVQLEYYELVRALWTDATLYTQPPKLRMETIRRVHHFNSQIVALITDICKEENLKSVDAKVVARIIFSIPDAICRWYQTGTGKLSAKQIANYLTTSIFWGFFLPDSRPFRSGIH